MILVVIRDAAHITKVPVRTIQRWVCRGWLIDYGDEQAMLVDLEKVTTLAEARPRGRLLRSATLA